MVCVYRHTSLPRPSPHMFLSVSTLLTFFISWMIFEKTQTQNLFSVLCDSSLKTTGFLMTLPIERRSFLRTRPTLSQSSCIAIVAFVPLDLNFIIMMKQLRAAACPSLSAAYYIIAGKSIIQGRNK